MENKKRHKNIFIGFIIFIILLIPIVYFIYNPKEENTDNNNEMINDYKIITEESKNCNGVAKLYFEISGKKIYTYCIDRVYIEKDQEGQELKYIQDENILNEMMEKIDYVATYKDGGSKLYRDTKKKVSNNGITILSCNTIEGNKDIYIGPSSMSYENNFCN